MHTLGPVLKKRSRAAPEDQYQRFSGPRVTHTHKETREETGPVRPRRELVYQVRRLASFSGVFFYSFQLTWPFLLTGRPFRHSQKATTGSQDRDILPFRLSEPRWGYHHSIHPPSSHASCLSWKIIQISTSKISGPSLLLCQATLETQLEVAVRSRGHASFCFLIGH